MKKNKQFYNIANSGNNTDCYIYGEIIGGADKYDESDVVFNDIKSCMDTISEGSNFNMYINSPGGSVFTTEAMINIIKRTKSTKNITVNAYIDGLGASCASWLPMVADNIYCYKGSILMVHKPMSLTFGNANDMQKEIDILNKLEDDTMIPMYMDKCKKTKEELKNIIANETWLSSDEMCDWFDITLLEDEKQLVAYVDKDLFKNYKNTPEELLNIDNSKDKESQSQIEEEIEAEKQQKELKDNLNNELDKLDVYLQIQNL